MAKVTFLSFYVEYSVGIYVLSSILQDAGHDVSVVLFKLPATRPMDWFKEEPRNMEWVNQYGDIIGSDIEVNPWTEPEVELLIKKINALSPDVLCISARSTHRDLVIDILPRIRSCCHTTTLAGGYGPTFEPELYVDLVDYVFIGEAENAIVELIDSLAAGNSIAHLANIACKRNGTMNVNPLRIPEVKTIRQVVPDKFFYIDNNRTFGYEDRGKVIKTHTYSTFVGRGCISSCSYCSAGHWRDIYKRQGINTKKRRNRDIEDVIEELKRAKDQNYTFMLFRDEFLCAEVKEMRRFFHLYEREINLPFWAYLVPEQILSNPDLLTMAVDAGFVDTEVGFQSGSDAINRNIFTRNISNARTLAYTRLLATYDINIRYDFIIFNPAETPEDIGATYRLIQALPKKRAYLALNRLFFFPVSPIAEIIKDYPPVTGSFDRYYCQALLYLLCFVMPADEFESILKNQTLTSSWKHLKELYKEYLRSHAIDFMIGTHNVPGSITTHRYRRILEKSNFKEIIVWGNGDYYKEMESIFRGTRIRHHIDERGNPERGIEPPDILKHVLEPIPLFICDPKKQEIKAKIRSAYRQFTGTLFV